MKLILYFGNTGTCKKAAELLKEGLPEAIVADGTKTKIKDLSNVDTLILGTNIHAGKPHKAFLKKLKKIKKKSLELQMHAFIVSANANEKGKYMNLVRDLLPYDSYVGYFGGELDPTHAKGITRMVIQMCINKFLEQDLELPKLDSIAIQDFLEHIR